ncbi:hypothetical protein AB0O75_05460 [Streptomyces sp. NPDC088921]|uniref:hypothetical protein n=1 Tax=unclassified Streptomyces TaxID=2593676 RepID=UPI00341DB609
MTAPIEVEIDRLVLHGVREPDAPAVLAAFRRNLAALLADPARSIIPVTTETWTATGQAPPAERDSERLGRDLAAAVARAVRR